MSEIVAVCMAVVAIILFGFGLGRVMYQRGYVHGFEDASPELTLDDDEGDE